MTMNILQIDYQSSQAGKQLVQSFKETGFAVIRNHPVSVQLLEQAKQEWAGFFASENKLDYLYDPNACPQDGYFLTESAKGYDKKDIKEFYHLYTHGRFPKGLSDVSWELKTILLNMGVTMLEWLQEYTPDHIKQEFSCPLPEMVDPEYQTFLRILHYPPQAGTEEAGALRAAPHEDINLITVLPASDEPGLQALALDGTWHPVPSDPGMIVINVGDTLQMASKGYYVSTKHRVVNPEGGRKHLSRFSFPMFVHARENAVLDKTRNFTAKDYLLERLTELGLRKKL